MAIVNHIWMHYFLFQAPICKRLINLKSWVQDLSNCQILGKTLFGNVDDMASKLGCEFANAPNWQ
jgi:hypothetical protein